MSRTSFRRSCSKVFLVKDVLKVCSKLTGEHPYQSVISIKLQSNLLKSHFGMGVLLQICCIFSEHLVLRTPLNGCFWKKSWTSSEPFIHVQFKSGIQRNNSWFSADFQMFASISNEPLKKVSGQLWPRKLSPG